mmetsp:Transcript_5835/g.6577  ORF Transcript_5835/g.6577 Transcript_5835/m.6577 type:complete len:278 (+) Transcript_5835:611-1444(+)
MKDYNPNETLLDRAIFNISMAILDHGIQNFQFLGMNNKVGLEFEFPHQGGTSYLGAAHGAFGIYYMILKSFEYIPLPEVPMPYFKALKEACYDVLEFQEEDGNFGIHKGPGLSNLVHWCHGAPGAIPFLLQCHEFYEDEIFLSAALKAGELVYKTGIIKKGNNLCHGIAGNVYPLMCLYSYLKELKTEDDLNNLEDYTHQEIDENIIKWKVRAYCIANSTYIKNVQIQCAKHKDPTRKVRGLSDTLYSLMEGRMGLAVMYLDILTKNEKMLFPGHQI